MPIDIDAATDAAAAPAPLQGVFEAALYCAAQQLIDRGGVSEVRVLQNGRVVTGFAANRQRVYVQYQRAGALTFDGECSCGERTPCVHIAAVIMTAARMVGRTRNRQWPRDSRSLCHCRRRVPWSEARLRGRRSVISSNRPAATDSGSPRG